MATLVFCLIMFAAAVVLIGSGKAKPPKPVPAPRIVRLEGEGDYEFEIVGESHYQEALEQICGGRCEEGHEFEATALLVPEPDNAYDANAVKVTIDDETVGYLSRDVAVSYQREMAARGLAGLTAHCDAMVVGGWERERRGHVDRGSFGVKLDVSWPLEVSAG